MKNVVLIGAGQIGSRHLQALAKIEIECNLTVIDPSELSLRRAQQRFDEISINPRILSIEFNKNLSSMPGEIDLCVIATAADIRLKALNDVLGISIIRNIIFEKVLFQSKHEIDQARELIRNHNVKAWVNCPLRVYDFYRGFKEECCEKDLKISYTYSGGDWVGLACNSIHYIDHLAFLSGSRLASVDTSNLDKVVRKSKRAGYVEFSGTLSCNFENGSKLKITSIFESEMKSEIKIETSSHTLKIDELSGVGEMTSSSGESKPISFKVPFQSELTQIFAKDILENGNCLLSDFEESAGLHVPFLQALSGFFSEITGKHCKKISIT